MGRIWECRLSQKSRLSVRMGIGGLTGRTAVFLLPARRVPRVIRETRASKERKENRARRVTKVTREWALLP